MGAWVAAWANLVSRGSVREYGSVRVRSCERARERDGFENRGEPSTNLSDVLVEAKRCTIQHEIHDVFECFEL